MWEILGSFSIGITAFIDSFYNWIASSVIEWSGWSQHMRAMINTVSIWIWMVFLWLFWKTSVEGVKTWIEWNTPGLKDIGLFILWGFGWFTFLTPVTLGNFGEWVAKIITWA